MPIYPAILTTDIAILQHQLDLAAKFSDLTAIQIDLIDGEYVDQQTVSLQSVVEVEKHDLPIDFHLMTNEPMDLVWELIDWKNDLPIRSVVAQIERMSYPDQFLAEVKNQGWRTGLALDIYTPWEEIDPAWLIDVDVIQLSGNETGRSGQDLNELIWPKLKAVRATLDQLAESSAAKAATLAQPVELVVDIGVNLKTAPKLIAAGVTGLVAASAIWNDSEPVKAFENLSNLY